MPRPHRTRAVPRQRLRCYSAGFNPGILTSAPLVLWLDGADTGTTFADAGLTTPQTADSGQVFGWRDKSGQGHNPTQPSNVPPLLKLNSVNGLPSLLFDASTGQYLTITGSALSLTRPYNVVLVERSNTAAGGTARRTINSSSANRLIAGNRSGGNSVFLGATESNYQTGDTTPHLLILRALASSSQYLVDGTDRTTTSTTTADWPNLSLGDDTAVNADEKMDANLCEVVVYSGDLSAGDRSALSAYLKAKWGTP